MTDPAAFHAAVREEAGKVLIDNEEILRGLSIAALTRGHVLLEGVPGVAKTTIANLFARASELEYRRIQMTPDILPADITGTHIYRENAGTFELQRGPVFANIVVADEINRATPKTQSALLEAMQEGTVTIEGDTLDLPEPFMVIATQNPIEMEGTFALPEAQRDRFQFKLSVDLPDRGMERRLLDRFDDSPGIGPSTVEPVVTPEDLEAARDAVADVHIADPVLEYILDIIGSTRESPEIEYGASPRASLTFLNTGKAAAAIEGRSYVIPDDIKALARPVLRHRLVLSTDAQLGGESVDELIRSLVESVPVPEEVSDDPELANQPTDD